MVLTERKTRIVNKLKFQRINKEKERLAKREAKKKNLK